MDVFVAEVAQADGSWPSALSAIAFRYYSLRFNERLPEVSNRPQCLVDCDMRLETVEFFRQSLIGPIRGLTHKERSRSFPLQICDSGVTDQLSDELNLTSDRPYGLGEPLFETFGSPCPDHRRAVWLALFDIEKTRSEHLIQRVSQVERERAVLIEDE